MQDEILLKRVELSLLYDFYGSLLKEHKRQVFEDYVLNDYSLSEIAKDTKISRQGVHDLIKRCSKELYGYEEKLSLMKKSKETKERIIQICRLAREIQKTGELDDRIEKIVALSNQILEE